MANASGVGGHRAGLGATLRTDNWWVGPSFTAVAFSIWLIYYFWASFQGVYYSAGPYVSPFYLLVSPGPPGSLARDHFLIPWPQSWPAWIPSSPALFIGALPGAFRLTCYYYRKAYYRAFFLTPPGCGVAPAARGGYRGETGILVVQNLHRYTVYIAILLLPVLWVEAFETFYWEGHGAGIGVGTVLLLGNAFLLSCYTLGCHAWRHLIGGRVNCFSCDGFTEAQHSAWSFTTWLNERHMQFAWASLWWIFACDVYIRLVSMGYIPDLNTWQGISWMGAH
jgi:hypothetical protein